MIIKNATQVGNPVIRKKAPRVTDFKSKETKKTVRDLIDSMREHTLVGMAAPQIGVSSRIFVTEIRETKLRKQHSKNDVDDLRVFINPKVISVSEKTVKDWEGCGSVARASLFGKVERPKEITVEAFNAKGEKFTLAAKGLLARVIQHEIDHINGIVFTDTADRKTFMSRDEYLAKTK
ncbi:MAG: peptide deformylase [Candidatus Paceibacteria bacterium]|jgi:peptide deformylase